MFVEIFPMRTKEGFFYLIIGNLHRFRHLVGLKQKKYVSLCSTSALHDGL